jgi:hypothetical protein
LVLISSKNISAEYVFLYYDASGHSVLLIFFLKRTFSKLNLAVGIAKIFIVQKERLVIPGKLNQHATLQQIFMSSI